MNLPTFAEFRRIAEQRAREIATRTPGTIAAEMLDRHPQAAEEPEPVRFDPMPRPYHVAPLTFTAELFRL